MRAGLIILCILTLLMISGAVPVKDGSQTAVFRSPVFIAAAAALAGVLILCCCRRLRWRQIPFLLCHLGLVLILAGALVRFLWSEKYEATIPVTASHRAFNLRMPGGGIRPLGFGLSVTKFTVEFYNTAEPRTPRHYEALLEFALPDGTMKQSALAVNRPATQGGWRFHLQSYDAQAGRYVILAIKRDPGLPAAVSGIWMVMFGTAGLCFRKRGKTDEL